MQNDYATTMGNSYRFDKNMAKNAKGALDKELINDLRSTHYTSTKKVSCFERHSYGKQQKRSQMWRLSKG